MESFSRRQFIGTAAIAALASDAPGAEAQAGRSLRVTVAGGHPGDPEAGCGGTMAVYADRGHEVVALYLTRGEAGVAGKSASAAAAIRTAEAEAACRILKARPMFASQHDGAAEVTAASYAEFFKLVSDLRPDVLFTQWQIDTHPDHRACALLAYHAWLKSGRNFALYYYEVDIGSDTQMFRPTDYVNVTATEARKRDACMAHASQNPLGGFYTKDHEPMLHFRGMESGFPRAEAFIHQDQSPGGRLP
jgi:LmbE family N-acetylglucosaminyl deacetylase